MMRRTITVLATLGAFCFPAAAWSQSTAVRAFMEKALDAQAAYKEGVNDYTVEMDVMGSPISQYYERTTVAGADGDAVETFRLVPFNEIQQRSSSIPQMTPAELELYARGLETAGAAASQEMNDSGLPAGMLTALSPADEPWASPDPRVSTGAMAEFLRAAASAEANADDGRADAAAQAADMDALIRELEIVGEDEIDGRPATHLQADGLNHTQVVDDQEFTMHTVGLWIDSEKYVPLRFRMDGVATVEGQSREIFIEKLDSDYRHVAGSQMYEPYRQVMRMGGVLDPEQQAQMAESRQQLAELDSQMASMPPGQRQMMEKMMGSKMAMLRSMVNGGAIEIETTVRNIRVNTGLTASVANSSAVVTNAAATDAAASSAPAATTAQATDAAALQAAQQACLKKKIKKAQKAREKKRGLGRLLSAVSRTASRAGNHDLSKMTGDVYYAGATADDIAAAAKDLGITEDDIEACENPK